MPATVYPHPTLGGQISLAIVDVTVDGRRPEKDPVDAAYHLISLHRLSESTWDAIEVTVRATAPVDAVEELEDKVGEIEAILVAFCRESNARQATALGRDIEDVATFQGTISLMREGFAGKVELYVVLAGAAEGRQRLWLGESEHWAIYFDEPAIPPIEGMLRVKWARFADPDVSVIPDGARTESFYVAVEDQPPTVYLNQDFPGLPELLAEDESRPAVEKALRDAEYRRIAAAAWSQMFLASVAAIERQDEEVLWPAEGWKRQVIEALLPDLYPDVGGSPEEALRNLYADITGGGTISGLLQVAIAKRIGAARSLASDIKRVTK